MQQLDLTYDEAYEEVVADSCESFLVDSNLIENVEELSKRDMNLANKIKDFLKNLLQKVREVYKKLNPDSYEGKYVREMRDSLSELHGKWIQGIKNATENLNNAKTGTTKNTANNDGVKYSVRTTSDGKKYVKADRQVIEGTDSSKWGGQVTNYINDNIRKGKDVVVYAQDGDALTITKDTAGKARFRNDIRLQDGTTRPMTDEEYALKLRAEAHIDELSVVSRRGKKDVPDKKNHNFAKDGFNYRTAYFLDFDGSYYRLTLSVGKNGIINTVYNVGKIKEEDKYSLSGSKPVAKKTATMRSSSSNKSISQDNSSVNNNSMQDEERNSLRDTAYLEAVNNGDMETAQRMVDEAAKNAGYTIKAYHGTKLFGFTKFNLAEARETKAIFLTDSQDIATSYSGLQGTREVSDAFTDSLDGISAQQLVNELNKKEYVTPDTPHIRYFLYNDMIVRDLFNGYIQTYIDVEQAKTDLMQKRSKGNYALYVKPDNMLTIDCKGAEYDEITGWNEENLNQKGTTDDVAKYAYEKGYDSVAMENLIDDGGLNEKLSAGTKATIYAVFNPASLKSSDTVTYDDNGDIIPLSKRFDEKNEDIRYSSRTTLDNIEDSFGISKVNDYVHVQKQVLQTLTNEGFFDNNIVTVMENNMVVEITKDGVKETLGPGRRYQNLPRLFKKIKLATIRDLPLLISGSTILEDNVSNLHNDDSVLKYAYLKNVVFVDDVGYDITIAIRKSPQKNKFWVHEIRVNKKEQSLSSSSDKLNQESMEFSVHTENISQENEDVNNETSDILYQARPDFSDILFDEFDGEVTDNDARLITEYIDGDVDTITHILNKTKAIELTEPKVKSLVSRMLSSYNLSKDSKLHISTPSCEHSVTIIDY